MVFIIALVLYACSVKLLLTFFSHSSPKPFFLYFFFTILMHLEGLVYYNILCMTCMRVCVCVCVSILFLHHYLDNYYSIIILYIHAYYLQKSCSLETAPTSRPIHSLHTSRGVLFDFPTCIETAIKKSCMWTLLSKICYNAHSIML